MVLIRIFVLLLLATAASGCSESLFDAHGRGGPSDDDDDGIPVPTKCPDDCLADAAADFNGAQGGVGNKWRYVDDHRGDRAWTPMTASAGVLSSGDGTDKLTSCRDQPDAAACAKLPGALLVASSDANSTDPAIEFKYQAPAMPGTPQVIQLSLHVFVPRGGAKQRVYLYRNSREDILFTADAEPNQLVKHAIVVPALDQDRFLIAIEPIGGTSQDIGLHFFINDTRESFPGTCQFALSFSSAIGSTVPDQCGGKLLISMQYSPRQPVPPDLPSGPFPELGKGADIVLGRYYASDPADILDHPGDTTIQLWVRHDMISNGAAWIYSELDEDLGGGVGFNISTAAELEVWSAERGNSNNLIIGKTPYPSDHRWHFIRVVHTADMMFVCVDGIRRTSFGLPAGQLLTAYTPYLGKNVEWQDEMARFDGGIDDVRVFSTALPCEPLPGT